MNTEEYFLHIQERVRANYAHAETARQKGLDPVAHVEIPIATSLAEKSVGLISTLYPQIADDRIVKRILELEKEHGSLDPAVALVIAEELAREKYCTFETHLQAIEAGIRVAVAYLTLGVVSSPIEGFVELEIKKTHDGKDYFAPHYSGPIRSAGGTEAAFSVVIIDHLREVFGYAPYDPTEDEIKRGVHETYMYHERINNLQYLPTEKEVEYLMRYVPIQVTGDPSEDREVYNYKDLPRIPTNFIRSGFALVMNEGVAQKAPKILKRIDKLKEKGFKLSNWNWLKDFVSLQKVIKESKSVGSSASATYIKDLVAGRPVFGHPSFSGAFRLRYGRSRNSGFSALAMHPATMEMCGGFIAVGTQIKLEKPTKGGVIASCDTVAGPIVKMKNGDVKKISGVHEAKKIYNDVEEIIYLGDLLVPYGDYSNRNHALDKPGFVEQYWLQILKSKNGNSGLFPDFISAVQLSKEFTVPLHPDYTFFWREITVEQFFGLLDWLAHGKVIEKKIILPYGAQEKERFAVGKRALELLGCEHAVATENVVVGASAEHLLFNLGIHFEGSSLDNGIEKCSLKVKNISHEQPVLKIINSLCSCEIRDIAGTFIGSRMGRPEKAKLRKLTGSPHVLFPVGKEGGRLRSFQSALEVGRINGEFPTFYCGACAKDTIYPQCEMCGASCLKLQYCSGCDKTYNGKCEEHQLGEAHQERSIDVKYYFDKARKLVGLTNDEVTLVKGVRGTSNEGHDCENLAKGILRAKYNLNVNKDGTIRYDISEMPITQFKPKEIGTSVKKLLEIGYEKDVYGAPLENENQLLELFPHDVILPACPQTLDEKADDVFLRIAQFVDDELEKMYHVDKLFNATKKEDLVGALLGCIAPHNCAAVVGRLIGFSKTQGFLASPYMHAAMRRDCDGDEAAAMLLMDMFLNFSRKYLPAHRGGTQDAPLVLNARMKAGEVDDMIFDLDVSREIPLELFLAAEEEKSPSSVKMEQIKKRLGGEKEFSEVWFSYDTNDINDGPLCSSYKVLPSMHEKVAAQMLLCKKIRAVDVQDVARLIIERHFIRDTRGNLRKFSTQGFRCVACNAKFRRPPLTGKCSTCGGKILFTISEGSILKYMQPALDLAHTYKVSPYLLESLELTQMYIQSIFGRDSEKQETISKWF